MEDYINRLSRCGCAVSTAYMLCWDFIKNFGREALDEYITDVEMSIYGDLYVDRV